MKFLYSIFIRIYWITAKFLSFFNIKAKKWIEGRRVFPKVKAHNHSTYKTIWMHCASVGEFEQGRPIIEKLKLECTNAYIIVTFFSASGYEVYKNSDLANEVFYLPLDKPNNAHKFLNEINPSLIIWVKYDFWNFYFQEISKRKIPLLLVSAAFRKQQLFFKSYGNFWRKMLSCFSYILVQNEGSLKLLQSININNTAIVGDTRFDRVAEIAENFNGLPLIEKFCGDNKVVVAGSTWQEDEEELTHFVKNNLAIKFIIAPHEVDAENIAEVQKRFPNSVLYSQLATSHSPTNCLIIDNIGLLSKLYYYATITYVGGGFGDDGVHNVLEAAVYGKPVIFGAEFDKYTEAIELVECGGAISIKNALELEKTFNKLCEDELFYEECCSASYNYVQKNKGATQKIVDYIYKNRLLTN